MSYGIARKDELNPHLIYELNENCKHLSHDHLLSFCTHEQDSDRNSAVNLSLSFVEQYKAAKKFIDEHVEGEKLKSAVREATGGSLTYPIAYRMSVETEAITVDDPYSNKFGGVPRPGMTRKGEMSVDRAWPHCPNCRRPMRFLGQVDLTLPTWVIHNLTAYTWGREFPTEMSAFGWLSHLQYLPATQYMSQYFFCPCHDFDSPNCDAVMLLRRMGGSTDADKHEEAQLRAFMEEHELLDESTEMCGHTPLAAVESLSLGVALDFPADRSDWAKMRSSALRDDFWLEFASPPCDYDLWGAPQSQQSEMRFTSSHPTTPFRMSPELCWSDPDHDITHQMYLCHRMGGQRHFKSFGRMDNSCT